MWFGARESVVMPFCALLRRVFNKGKPYLTFRCAGYMAASRTKDEPCGLPSLGMKGRLGQSFDFQNQRQLIKKHSTLERV